MTSISGELFFLLTFLEHFVFYIKSIQRILSHNNFDCPYMFFHFRHWRVVEWVSYDI